MKSFSDLREKWLAAIQGTPVPAKPSRSKRRHASGPPPPPRRTRSHTTPTTPVPLEEFPCKHRKDAIGKLVCNCANKPLVFTCSALTHCILHPLTVPTDGPIVTPDGTRSDIHYLPFETADDNADFGPTLQRMPVCAFCKTRSPSEIPWPPPIFWDPTQLRYLRTIDLVSDALRLVGLLPPNISGICGIPRSGMIPAAALATVLHVPLYFLDRAAGPTPAASGSRERTLHHDSGPLVVIDDTTWSGRSIARARSQLSGLPAVYAAVYVRSPAHVDLYSVHHPRCPILEWNFFNSFGLHGKGAFDFAAGGVALDFDGVLCENPPISDLDERFPSWLSQARPLLLPRRFPVPLVITARIEAWRPASIAWLQKWDVQVNQLEMHPAATPRDRRKTDIASWKADLFRRSPCSLMFESEPSLARAIHELTNKTTICPSTAEVWQASRLTIPASPDTIDTSVTPPQ